ncbi:MAG TPA: hypothetical protein VII63_13175 [Caulobacteraceae bacterium]
MNKAAPSDSFNALPRSFNESVCFFDVSGFRGGGGRLMAGYGGIWRSAGMPMASGGHAAGMPRAFFWHVLA